MDPRQDLWMSIVTRLEDTGMVSVDVSDTCICCQYLIRAERYEKHQKKFSKKQRKIVERLSDSEVEHYRWLLDRFVNSESKLFHAPSLNEDKTELNGFYFKSTGPVFY